MKRTHSIASALLMVTTSFVASDAIHAQLAPRENPPAGDWMQQRPTISSVVVQIERPTRGERLITPQMAVAVLQSSAVLDVVLEAATKLPAADARRLVTMEAEISADSYVMLRVTVPPESTDRLPGDAGRLVLHEWMRQSIGVLTKAAEAQLEPMRQQLLDMNEQVERAQAAYDEARARVREAGPRVQTIISAVRGNGGRADLERQRTMLRQQLAGARARVAAMEPPSTQPAEVKPDNSANASAASNAIRLAETLVRARQREVDDLEGAVRTEEMAARQRAAANDLLEAQVLSEMAQAHKVWGRPVEQGGASELRQLRGVIAQAETNLVGIEEQLAAIAADEAASPSTTRPVEEPITQAEFQALNVARDEAAQRWTRVRQERDAFEPVVSVMRVPRITPLVITPTAD